MATTAEVFSTDDVSLSLLSIAGEPSMLGVDDTRGSATSTMLSGSSVFSPTEGTTTAMLGSMPGVPRDMPGFSHFATGVADTIAIAAVEPEIQIINHNMQLSLRHTAHNTAQNSFDNLPTFPLITAQGSHSLDKIKFPDFSR